MTNRSKHHPAKDVSTRSRAAAYVRMSTGTQRYSIANQMKVIRRYAESHGIEIVKIYQDAAKSGLTMDGRDALVELFMDVISRRCDFEEILVYDVSRWGRFQDIDESAHYEFLCKKQGVRVTYCAELFVNDGTAFQAIAKSVKRAMAAEWSRERSARVTAGRLHLASLGFYPGGSPAYGIARVAVNSRNQRRNILKPGHLRSVMTDHVMLAPGPKNEVKVVRDIFRMYVEEKMSANNIVRVLNKRGVSSPRGKAWSLSSVLSLLSNAIYIGKLYYNRTSTRLKQYMGNNERSRWIVIEGITKPIIDERTFARAQRIRRARRTRKSDQELLDELRDALEKYGTLSSTDLNTRLHLSSPWTYAKRFGSLRNAYRLIGKPRSPRSYIWERSIIIRQMRVQILHVLMHHLEKRGMKVSTTGRARNLEIDGKLKIYLDLPYAAPAYRGKLIWRLRMPEEHRPDFYLAGLLQDENSMPFEYYMIPGNATTQWSVVFRGRKSWLTAYRHPKLQGVLGALGKSLA